MLCRSQNRPIGGQVHVDSERSKQEKGLGESRSTRLKHRAGRQTATRVPARDEGSSLPISSFSLSFSVIPNPHSVTNSSPQAPYVPKNLKITTGILIAFRHVERSYLSKGKINLSKRLECKFEYEFAAKLWPESTNGNQTGFDREQLGI